MVFSIGMVGRRLRRQIQLEWNENGSFDHFFSPKGRGKNVSGYYLRCNMFFHSLLKRGNASENCSKRQKNYLQLHWTHSFIRFQHNRRKYFQLFQLKI